MEAFNLTTGASAVHARSVYGSCAERAESPACSPTGIMRNGRMLRYVRTDADVTCKKCLADKH